jgi:hypothetical protein
MKILILIFKESKKMKLVMIKMILSPAVLVFYRSMARNNLKRLLMILFFWEVPAMKTSSLVGKMINNNINQLKISAIFLGLIIIHAKKVKTRMM